MAHSELYIGDLATPLFYFTDRDLTSANGSLSVDLTGNKLAQDVVEINIVWDKVSENIELFAPFDFDAILDANTMFFATNFTGTEDVSTIPYGTPCWYYFDSHLVGKFYFKNAIRTTKNTYELTLFSAIGLLGNRIDKGGIYKAANGDKFSTVLAKILDGTVGNLDSGFYPITGGVFDCLVEQAVADLPIEGWLPYATKRENLHEILFGESVTLTKSADGTPLFSFLFNQDDPYAISDTDIYVNGRVQYQRSVTAVNVVEHNYINRGTSDTLIVLFNGTTNGEDVLVIFDEPIHGNNNGQLIGSGIIVQEWGANYAIINGTGTLSGYRYSHSMTTVRREVPNPTGEENEVTVSDVTVINALNSTNVANRLLAYYSAAVVVEADIVKRGEDPQVGRQYSFTDPFGESKSGFITDMELFPSTIMKASCKIVTDYVPQNGGDYSHAQLFTSGSIVVPDGVTKMRLYLIGGGTGGANGTNGSNGGVCTAINSNTGIDTSTAIGGAGGTGGAGGSAAKVLVVDLDPVTPGDVITVTYGTGGAAGVQGTDTEITYNGTTYSSATGVVPIGGVSNLFTGDVYAKNGVNGRNGGKGGDFSSNGSSVSFNGTTYNGGSSGWFNVYDPLTSISYDGGGGGGAAVGASGSRGYPSMDAGGSYIYQANGGDGANASNPDVADYGCGGNGGHGGGGGGASGYERHNNVSPNKYYPWTPGGQGGTGSAGGKGGDGCVLIYY